MNKVQAKIKNSWVSKVWPEKERFQAALNFTLFSAIIGALSLSTYIGTNSLVTKDMQARLDMEASSIHRTFVDRVQSYSDTLLNLRAFLSRMGVKDSDEFKDLLSEMKVFDYYTGVSSIGLSVVFPKSEKEKFEKAFDLDFHDMAPFPPEETPSDEINSLGAAVVAIEPESIRKNRGLGYDSFSEPNRRESLSQALALNTTVVTPPVVLFGDQLSPKKNDQLGFVMMVPFQTDRQFMKLPPQSHPTTGIIWASFRYQVLLNEVFGPPSLEEEKWNFTLYSERSGQSTLLYDRFKPQESSGKLASLKKFSVYGQSYYLKVTPLPNFYTNSDKYLPLLTCIGTLLVGSLMLLLYRSTLNQLKEEKFARIRSRRTHEKLRQQTTLLSKLNRFGMTISKQFDPEIVLQKFFEFGEKEEFEFVSILKEEEDSKDLVLITPHGVSPSNIQLGQINELFGAVNRIGRSDLDHSPPFLKYLRLSTLSDWQMIRVRFNQRSSFLIIGLRSESIDEEDIELMKSTFSQLVVALETAVLLQKAEEGSRLKTAFLANMSHEIRTPLNAILGFTQILTKSDVPEDKRIQLVQNIEKNTNLLTRLIDDILDIAKVEAGKIDIVQTKTSLETLLQDTEDIFALKAHEKGIYFSLQIKTELPKFVKTDEYRFKQILFNLISNAIKFTDRGQVIVRVYGEASDKLSKLTFEIEDTGVGIAKEMQDQLFSAFFQGDISTTRRFGGSGLGLTLSRRLAGEMNGDIQLLSSEVGKGSIFSFHIDCFPYSDSGTFRELTRGASLTEEEPTIETKKSETPSIDKENPPLNGRTVLLVEDSEDNQIIFTHFLEQSGANVSVAVDGKEALTQARQIQELDLILMDIQIPFIDGREVTRILRSEGFKIPIIALTAHALESEKRSCREAGCNDQITKPTTYGEFVRVISRHVDRAQSENYSFV